MHDRCGSVLPWVTEPYRLWSLLEMLKIFGDVFAAANEELGEIIGDLNAWVPEGYADVILNAKQRKTAQLALKSVEQSLQNLPVSTLLKFHLVRAADRLTEKELSWSEAATTLKDVRDTVFMELNDHIFLVVPNERFDFYQQPEPPFGRAVAEAFPEAAVDISEGTRCIAVDQFTASVFHLMRAAEWALRRLALATGVQDVERKDFGQLVQETRDKYQSMSNRDPAKQHPATALATLDLFNNAWRNPVVHSRDNYDERRALDVWNGVRAFMQSIASGAP